MNKPKIKTAVVGYGFSAKTFHIPFVTTLPEFELVAVSTSKSEELAQEWPNVDNYLATQDMIENSDAELVIITAPNDVHYSLAKLALENGKHVIIEKPFVTSVEDGEKLIALAEKNQLVLSVYHNRRWDGDFLTVKKLLENNRLGDLKHYESHFDRFRPQVRQRWREQAIDGGGILFDLGSHLIDQALELFGLPESIYADCKVMREGGTTVDYFDVTLEYPNHVAVLHGDMVTAGTNKRFTVKGTQGTYEKLGLDPQEGKLIAGERPTHTEWAEEESEQYGCLYLENASEVVKSEVGCYQDYFSDVAKAIRTNSQPAVTAASALATIKLIQLATESSRLGQKLQLP